MRLNKNIILMSKIPTNMHSVDNDPVRSLLPNDMNTGAIAKMLAAIRPAYFCNRSPRT